MITITKFALATLLMIGVASAAQAGVDRGSALTAANCPALEGYPDCRPDARALWLDYSTNSRHPDRSQFQRRPPFNR
jgi:hypothetical protein